MYCTITAELQNQGQKSYPTAKKIKKENKRKKIKKGCLQKNKQLHLRGIKELYSINKHPKCRSTIHSGKRDVIIGKKDVTFN